MATDLHIDKLVEHLFRHESGKLVAVLTSVFGLHNMELAEDVVQETLADALATWPYSGVPDNANGWLYRVAKNKALNMLKREQYGRDHALANLSTFQQGAEADDIFSEQEVADGQLRMMFACCHPAISPDSQVALILKTLCGFSVQEIAQAFITTTDNIEKRLVRARKAIRDSAIQLEIPAGQELKPRLETVVEAIYLLFNEGYHATQGEEVIRRDLCIEAIRLAQLLEQHAVGKIHVVYSLLALMFFNASRFDARLNESGSIVLLDMQDRSRWDRAMIAHGHYNMGKATAAQQLSLYYVLAAISAQHCYASRYEDTNWTEIVKLYDYLIVLQDSPVNRLNRAVALMEAGNITVAMEEVDKLSGTPSLKDYYPLYVVLAELAVRNNSPQQAIKHLLHAIRLCSNGVSKRLLFSILENIENKFAKNTD